MLSLEFASITNREQLKTVRCLWTDRKKIIVRDFVRWSETRTKANRPSVEWVNECRVCMCLYIGNCFRICAIVFEHSFVFFSSCLFIIFFPFDQHHSLWQFQCVASTTKNSSFFLLLPLFYAFQFIACFYLHCCGCTLSKVYYCFQLDCLLLNGFRCFVLSPLRRRRRRRQLASKSNTCTSVEL